MARQGCAAVRSRAPRASTMNIRRVALAIGSATLLAAWLSSADSLSPARGSAVSQVPADTTDADEPARIDSELRRLRDRLATVPHPRAPLRNPFMFAPVDRPSPEGRAHGRIADARAAAAAMDPGPAEPELELIGVAEKGRGDARVRTAVIASGAGDLLMVTAGETLLDRYTVLSVGGGSVELSDAQTGRARRLVLR